MTYYRRKPADATVIAGAVAAGTVIGAAAFYLVKLWLQREPLEPAVDLDEPVPETSEAAESSP